MRNLGATDSLRTGKRYTSFLDGAGDDPMSGVANLFDVAMVFAVALILGVFHVLNVPEMLNSADEVTIIKNPGKANMEILQKKGLKLEKFTMSDEDMGGDGMRLGVCYRMADGEMVYVPDEGESQEATPPVLDNAPQ